VAVLVRFYSYDLALLKPLIARHSLRLRKLHDEQKKKARKANSRQKRSRKRRNRFVIDECDVDECDDSDESLDNNETDLMDTIIHANGIDLESDQDSVMIESNTDDFGKDQTADESDEIVLNVLKRGSSMICLDYNRLRFLDIMNYVCPGTSLSQYLKTYKAEQTKQFFPYEYVDSLDKLNDDSLPAKSQFYSKLKDTHISHQDYEHCRQIWRDKNMSTLRDYLSFYNISDVQPFLTAIEHQFSFYESLNIDMFKDAVSLPGISLQVMFQHVPKSVIMPQLFSRDISLYKHWKQSICGGLSIILHRYHESGKTFIKNQPDKVCMKILGVDCINCYGASFTESFPTGMHCRYFIADGFKRQKVCPYGFDAVEWLTYVMEKENIFIQHKFNGGEVKIYNMSVDGFCRSNNTVYEYLGCVWHGHNCYFARHESGGKPRTHSPYNKKKSLDDLYEETERRLTWLRSLGYTVITMWGCVWNFEKKFDPELSAFADEKLFNAQFHPPRLHDSDTILSMIYKDELFGMCRVNIFTPTDLKDYFAEFPPIFKSSTITLYDIGDHMREAAINSGLSMFTKRRNLILSYYGCDQWIASPLLKWYLSKKLKIEVLEFVSFTPKTCFKEYIQLVTNKRRLGDIDKNSALIADQMKKLSNSSYGKFVTNLERQVNVTYGDSIAARSSINKDTFRRLEKVDQDVYEINLL